MNKYKVLIWNITRDSPEWYDVLPHFQDEIDSLVKKKRIRRKDITYDWLTDFVKREAKYQYWSRCEYEIIVTGWPIHKNEEKMDVYDQIMANFETVVRLLYENQTKTKKRTT